MLLYDRVMEHVAVTARRLPSLDRFGSQNLQILKAMQMAGVYELSNCVPLLDDWEAGRVQGISKRPPHNATWVEWRFKDIAFDSVWDISIACLIMKTSKDALRDMLPTIDSIPDQKTRDDLSLNLDLSTEWYSSFSFTYVHGIEWAGGKPPDDFKLGPFAKKLTCDPGMCLWAGREDFSKVQDFKTTLACDYGKGLQPVHEMSEYETLFFLPAVMPAFPGDRHPVFRPWPAFLAFALLHCKNVSVRETEPDPKLNQRQERAKLPPRVSFKTIEIEVPAAQQNRQCVEPVGGDDDSPKVRFHLCRGHFKHLQSERYKDKRGQWVWCPAHWKGSKDLGKVIKNYSVGAK